MEFIRKNVNGGSSSSGGGGGGISTPGTSTTLETHTIFGQPYNGTNDVRGDLNDVNNINANGDIALDGQIIFKGKDEDGAYSGDDVSIKNDGDQILFEGASEYDFDNDVKAPKFIGDVESEFIYSKEASIDSLESETISVNETLYANNIDALSAYITELLSDSITVDNLTVTKAAHFFSLIIDEIKSVGGQIILSPANATIDIVKTTSTGNYKCYFKAKCGDRQISNQFLANDLVVCQTFNATEGTSYDVSNTFYWRKVNSKGTEKINDEDYHYIILSGSDCAEGSGVPSSGDKIVTLGNKNTTTRQNAIVLSAYNSDFLDKGLKAPSIVQYKGINDYQLTTHRYNVISNGLNLFRGNLQVESGTSVESLIDGVKYDRMIVKEAKAIVNIQDVLNVDISGSVLPISDESYSVEVIRSSGVGVSLAKKADNTFSYALILRNYSTSSPMETFFTLNLRQDGQIIQSHTIPVVFDAGSIFEVTDDAITAAVQDLEGDISRVEQKADSITSTVQNMKIGGKNLIDDSEFNTWTDATIWKKKSGSATKSYGYMNQLGIHDISKPINVNDRGYLELAEQDLVYKLQPDTYYTFSFYAKGVNGSSTYKDGAVSQTYKYKGRVDTYVYPDVGSEVSDNHKQFITNSTWTRYSYTFKTKADLDTTQTYHILFRLISDESGGTTYYSNTYVCMPKLEEGTMASAWNESGEDIKSIIKQTADGIEAKIVSEDEIKSLISQDKDEIKAEVYNELNQATGINIRDGSITLNADKTTIRGNLNITDTQNGLTVYETTNYNGQTSLSPRINLQPKPIADIADLPSDEYNFFSKSVYEANNNTWSLDFGSNDYSCNKDDCITFDKFSLMEQKSNSSGTQNFPYVTTCKIVLKMYLVKNGTPILQDSKEVTLNKKDSYGRYASNDLIRFAIPSDGTYRFSASSELSQTALSTYPIMYASLSIRFQKASRATTYLGTDGMFCHSGANKLLYVNEKQTMIQHGFNGIKWDNSDVMGNRSMKVVVGADGTIPNMNPIWFPFYNYTPTFKPSNGTLMKIVNDGNSYSRYAYKINPKTDCGICYIESAFMDSSLNYVETWILLPPSYYYDEDGKLVRLPLGYTIDVINGGFGNSKFNAYVSADVSKSHQAVFIDGHRDKNWKVSLNNEVHWERFMYVGSYYSSDCSDNQDIWMTLGDAQ